MLQVGVYKNYKELCGALGWDVKAGDSKKAQMKELDKICTYKRVGNSFIIKRLKTETQSKITDDKTQKSDIELLLLDMLYNAKDNCVNLVSKDLFRNLNIVNDNYVVNTNYEKDYKKLSEAMGIDEDIVEHVFYLTSNKNSRMVKRALISLENKALIKWEKRMCVCRRDRILTPDGYLYGEREYGFATKEEMTSIVNTENSIMKDMGVTNLKYFMVNKEAKKVFEKKVNSRLLRTIGVEYYYYSYYIVYSNDGVKEELDKLTKRKKNEIKSRLNKNTLQSILKIIENGHDKTMEKADKIIGNKKLFIEYGDCEVDKIRIKKDYKSKANNVARDIVKISKTVKDFTNIDKLISDKYLENK